jgi:histone-lysine N-methyltransferase SETMAR
MPTKAQNKVWAFEDENTPVSVRKSRSVKKRTVAVFFTVGGIVECMVLETQKTVTEECLPRVVQAVKNIRPHSRADTWFFHHDNPPAHRSKVCIEYLPGTGLKVLEHPLYSPNLAPCDFALFPYVKNRLKVRRFSNEEDLLRAWDDECAQIPEET